MSDLSSNPYQVAPETDQTAKNAAKRGPYAHAQRLAGGLMVAGAVVTFLVMLAELGKGPGGPGAGFIGLIIDLAIGISLLRGNERYKVWAIVRAVVGAVVYGLLPMFAGHPISGIVGVLVSVGFLLMLVGAPGRFRTFSGAALVCLVLLIVSIVVIVG